MSNTSAQSETRLAVFGAFDEVEARQLAASGATDLFCMSDDEMDADAYRIAADGCSFGFMCDPRSPTAAQVKSLARFASAGWPCAIWTNGVDVLDSPAAAVPMTAEPQRWTQVNYWEHDDAPFFRAEAVYAAAAAWSSFTLLINSDLPGGLARELRNADSHPEWGEFSSHDVSHFLTSANLILGAAWVDEDFEWLARRAPNHFGGLAFICSTSPERFPSLPAAARPPHEIARLLEVAKSIMPQQ